MKRFVTILLFLTILLSMTGCVANEEPPEGVYDKKYIKVGTASEYVNKCEDVLGFGYYFFYREGIYFVVGEYDRHTWEVAKLERILAFIPQKDAYRNVKEGMTLYDAVRHLGMPIGVYGSGMPCLAFRLEEHVYCRVFTSGSPNIIHLIYFQYDENFPEEYPPFFDYGDDYIDPLVLYLICFVLVAGVGAVIVVIVVRKKKKKSVPKETQENFCEKENDDCV